jgi:archaellum biogenesis ATPase FlaH
MKSKEKNMGKNTRWIIEGLIPEGQIILVLGQPGNYKSWWMGQLAVDVAGRYQHLNAFDAKPASVIYIDEDTPEDVFGDRLDRIASARGIKVADLPIKTRPMEGFFLADKNKRAALKSDIRLLKAQGKNVLVIIDSLIKVTAGSNLDRTAGASKVMSYLTELRDAGATIVAVHHMTIKKKVELDLLNLLGLALNSTVLISVCDTAFIVLGVQKEGESLFLIVPQARRVSLSHSKPFGVMLLEDDKQNWALLEKMAEIPKFPSEDVRRIFPLFRDDGEELSVKETCDRVQKDFTEAAVREALHELEKEGCLKLDVEKGKSHRFMYRLHPDFNNADRRTTRYMDELRNGVNTKNTKKEKSEKMKKRKSQKARIS